MIANLVSNLAKLHCHRLELLRIAVGELKETLDIRQLTCRNHWTSCAMSLL